jgi:hypothetical protein
MLAKLLPNPLSCAEERAVFFGDIFLRPPEFIGGQQAEVKQLSECSEGEDIVELGLVFHEVASVLLFIIF